MGNDLVARVNVLVQDELWDGIDHCWSNLRYYSGLQGVRLHCVSPRFLEFGLDVESRSNLLLWLFLRWHNWWWASRRFTGGRSLWIHFILRCIWISALLPLVLHCLDWLMEKFFEVCLWLVVSHASERSWTSKQFLWALSCRLSFLRF